jgi:NAD(P)H-hydrate epimerase
LERADAILLGPGLRDSEAPKQLCLRVLRECELPLVADAGALAAIAGDLSVLKKRKAITILTPHAGEMSRLLGIASDELEEHHIDYAIAFAKTYKVILVLKGSPTIVATPEGKVYISPVGNPGMATAGTGDVLAGMIASFVARDGGADGLIGTLFAVYAHGLAGDIAAKATTQNALMATDLIHALPEAFRQLGVQ